MSEVSEKLSTSALARQLDIPIQQLFAVLRDYEWIKRADDEWILTQKGEFEGGTYRNSKRFGRYIVWPQKVATHPLLVAIEAQQRHSAAEWAEREGLPHPVYIERMLVEIGWLKDTPLGTVVTALGASNGGEVADLGWMKNGVVYWPSAAEHNSQLQALIHAVKRPLQTEPLPNSDLFELTGSGHWAAIDGRECSSALQARCSNWLYLRRIHFSIACQLHEGAVADIYLPDERAVILFQPHTMGSAQWKRLIDSQSVFERNGYRVLLFTSDFESQSEYRLDHWLRELWALR